MPSKKNARGRGRPVQKRQKEERPEREIIEKERGIADRERDVPSPSSSSSVDVVPETVLEVITVTQKELSSEEEPTVQPKKRIRVSKKEIPEYQWTDEGTRKLSEYVKDHPMLFDKRQKDWLNVAAKSQLWKQAGEQQEPPATGAQCKKFYENTRTRVGKIMNKERKSGAGQPERSVREQEIMDTWGFLIQHIVRGITIPSEQFAIQGPSETVTWTDEEELDDDLSSAGSHVPYIRGKGKGIGKRSNLSSAAASTSSVASAPSITKTDLNEAVMQMLSKADSMGDTPTFSGHRKIVHDFTCLLEGHMLAIPEDSWHDFEIVCLNLVQRFRQRGQATQQQQQQQHQQQPQSWESPQQQVWQSSQQQQHPQAWQQPSHTCQFSQSSQAPQQQSPPWPQWTGTIGWDQGGPAAPSSTPVQVPSPSGQSVIATRQSSVSQSPVFKTPVTPIALTPGSGDSSLEGLSPLLRTTDMDTPPIVRVSPDSGGASSSKDTE